MAQSRSSNGPMTRPRRADGRNDDPGVPRQPRALQARWDVTLTGQRNPSASHGRPLVAVDPRNTSTQCSGCGVVDPDNRNARAYKCGDCGLRMDADQNAAINILARGMSAAGVGIPPVLAAD